MHKYLPLFPWPHRNFWSVYSVQSSTRPAKYTNVNQYLLSIFPIFFWLPSMLKINILLHKRHHTASTYTDFRKFFLKKRICHIKFAQVEQSINKLHITYQQDELVLNSACHILEIKGKTAPSIFSINRKDLMQK